MAQGRKVILAMRWFALGFTSALATWLVFDPSLLVIVSSGVVAGFVLGALSVMVGDLVERLLGND